MSDINKKKVNIDKVIKLSLSKDTIYLYKGQSKIVTADLAELENVDDDIVWSSDNENIATVDKNGNITGIDYGTTYVNINVGKNLKNISKIGLSLVGFALFK